MRVALIAHDNKKLEMLDFCKKYELSLSKHSLVATGTTGRKVMEITNLKIECMKSGPLGGDQEIGAKIANDELDIVFFFRDPLTMQPHEPDVTALLRLCDVYKIPVATNISTGECLINSLK